MRAQPDLPKQAEIPGVIQADATLEVVAKGMRGLEGPTPSADGGLYFTEIEASRIHKLGSGDRIAVWRAGTGRANGLYSLPDGSLLAAEAKGRRIVSITPGGEVKVLADMYRGAPLRSPNDLIPDRKGGIYFTDPAPRPGPNIAPKEPGNVYYIRAGGEVLLIDSEIHKPNGITLSHDGRTLYVDDTEGEFVYAFDVQPDGSCRNKRTFVRLLEPERGSLGMRCRGDGMALDSEGRLYVGTGVGVQVIDPKGRHLGIIRVPSAVRNLAFAGRERRTLYMTALDTLYRVRLVSRGPLGRAK